MAQQNQPTAAEMQAQLRYLQNVYSQQYELLDNEIATFAMAISSVEKSLSTLENKERLSNSTVLINGEGGIYLEAGIKSLEKVLVYVGAGYVVEKDTSGAIEYLKENARQQGEAMRKLSADKQKISGELVDISYKLAALEQSQQGTR